MKKIVIIGPESTGKSTLCKDLSNYFNCSYVPEYARTYLEEFGADYSYEHILNMAQGQQQIEYVFLELNPGLKFAFIDTNQYVFKVWIAERYNKIEPVVENYIAKNAYDFYFLCDIDLPWEFDELREHPNPADRARLFARYHELLEKDGTPYLILSGNRSTRLQIAIEQLKKLM